MVIASPARRFARVALFDFVLTRCGALDFALRIVTIGQVHCRVSWGGVKSRMVIFA